MVAAKWHRNIVNYTHADFQLCDMAPFSSRRINRLDPGIELVISLLDDNKHASCENLRMRRENPGKTKEREPVSSTSRRGARAAYHDEYPRDFGPRIACTVS